MNVISLNEDSSTAVYYAGSVLTRLAPSSELLVFCRNPALTDSSGDYGTYLASWHEYSVDELILRAQEQLQSFSSLTG